MFGKWNPSKSDYLITGAVLCLALFGTLVSPDDAGPAAIALTVAQTAPLLYRRRVPSLTLAVVLLATALYFLIHGPLVTTAFLGLMVAVYALAVHGGDRAALFGNGATIATVAGLFALEASQGRDVNAMDALIYMGLVGVAWALGDRAKARRAYTRSLEERAEEAERARAIEAAAAAATERTRIARELHDVVGHSVSTMVLHASAAKQILDGDPAAARESLDLIEGTGRAAVGELRMILHALRTEEDEGNEELRPQPGLAALGELADRTRGAGIDVDVTAEGAERPLPSSVDLSAYRILQEALTNTIKHSGARRAEVVVRFTDNHLLLQVTDDGRGPGTTTDGGFGLSGMRERAELLGGWIQAGPRRKGGFEVLALLPLPEDGR